MLKIFFVILYPNLNKRKETMMYEGIVVSANVDEFLAKRTAEKEERLLIILCRAGYMKVTLNQELYTLSPDQMLFCLPDCLVGHYSYTSDFQCEMIAFQAETLHNAVYLSLREDSRWWEKTQYISAHPILKLNKRQLELIDVFQHLKTIYENYEMTPARARTLNILTQAIVAEMLSWVEELIPANNRPMRHYTRKEVLFAKFLELLSSTHGTEREVKWYADQLAISPKYLTDICRQVRGKNASELIDYATAQELKYLLLQTNLSAKEICIKLRFSNFSFFCKYARRLLGTNVTKYRRIHMV